MSDFEKDQQMSEIRDSIPRLWRNLYIGSIEQGFSPVLALLLVQTWILSQCPNGIHPNSPPAGEEGDGET